MNGVLAGLIMAATATGCTTPPKLHLFSNSASYTQTFDDVWTAVIETFADMNLPIDNLEKDSGLITTDWIDFGVYKTDVCDCGGSGLTVDKNFRGKFNVFVKSTESGAELKINAVFDVDRTFDGNPVAVQCNSTGLLEQKMKNLVSNKLGVPVG